MANRAPAPASSVEIPNIILFLNANDVILGRGGPNKFIGNQRFRDVVDERRAEYVSYDSYKEKARIGEEVFNKITARGGRFIKFVMIGTDGDAGYWQEVPRKVALEKCKQALREIKKPKKGEKAADEACEAQIDASTASVLQASLLASVGALAADPRLLLFQQQALMNMQQHPPLMQQQQQPASPFYPLLLNNIHLRNTANAYPPPSVPFPAQQGFPHEQFLERAILQSHLRRLLQGHGAASVGPAPPGPPAEMQVDNSSTPAAASSLAFIESSETDRQDAAFALSALAVADRPRFTKEQELLEQATMTNEERVAALCDLFGKCTVAGTHQNKRARQDLDRESLEFLVGEMRYEMDQIPPEKKQALLEAQAKCRAEEFSDDRLEMFLRCEGMNTKLAAERFLAYWHGRREIFGDKFTLPMTLSEAMRDDLAALKAGVYRILPNRDSSGRQLIILEPRRNTGDGYTPESLLRAVWYTIEVAAQQCTDVRSGFVYIGWNKDSSLYDISNKVFGRIAQYEKTCWPMKFVAAHICGSSSLVFRIIMPIINALTDRRGRSRMVIHDVPDDELLEALAGYGINPSILPKSMGGSVVLDQAEWIANRHAVELEEI